MQGGIHRALLRFLRFRNLRQSRDLPGAMTPHGAVKDRHEMLVNLDVSCTDHAKKGLFCPLGLLRRSQHVSQKQCVEEEVIDEQS